MNPTFTVVYLRLDIGGWTVLDPIGGTIVYYNDGNFNYHHSIIPFHIIYLLGIIYNMLLK